MPLVQLPDGLFEVTVPLKAQDKIMYKYIVDGEWLVLPTQRVCRDEHGIDNNYIESSDLVDSSASGSRIPEAGGLAFGGAASDKAQSKSAVSQGDAPGSDAHKSIGSRIPEAGGLIFGGAAAQHATHLDDKDLKATVMPVEPLRQQTLGEPGVVIPQGDQLKAFENVRHVDPATLNQPEPSNDVTGVAIPQGDQLKAFETVRDVDPATLNQPQGLAGDATRELTPEERKKQKKKVKRTQYKRKKKLRDAAATNTTLDSSPEPEEGLVAGGALHHPDGPRVAEDKRELAQDAKEINAEPHPDKAFTTDPFLEAPHDKHRIENVGEHIERQLHGDEVSPGTVDVSGVTQPITSANDPGLRAAEKNHNVEQEGEHLEELLVGDSHPHSHTNTSAGAQHKDAIVGTGLPHEAAHPDGPRVAEDKRELAQDVRETNAQPHPDKAFTTDPYLQSAGGYDDNKLQGNDIQDKLAAFGSDLSHPESKQAFYGSDLDKGAEDLGADAVVIAESKQAIITNDGAFVTKTLVAGEAKEVFDESTGEAREVVDVAGVTSGDFITPEPKDLELGESRELHDSQKLGASSATDAKDVAHHNVDGVNPVPLPVVSAEKQDLSTTEPKADLKDTEAVVPKTDESIVPVNENEAAIPIVAQEKSSAPVNEVSKKDAHTDGPITERGFNAPDAHDLKNDDVYAVPEPTVNDVERPKTLDPKGSEPTLLKDGEAPSKVEPSTVEEEIVVADGTASRKQIEKEIQAKEGKDVVLEEFTPNPEIAGILEAEATAKDASAAADAEHAKTIVVDKDTDKPVEGKTASKTTEGSKTTSDGKAKQQASTTKKPAAAAAKKPAASTAKKTSKEPEKKKSRFSRILKKIFS